MAKAKTATKLDANGIPLVDTSSREDGSMDNHSSRLRQESKARGVALLKLVRERLLAGYVADSDSSPPLVEIDGSTMRIRPHGFEKYDYLRTEAETKHGYGHHALPTGKVTFKIHPEYKPTLKGISYQDNGEKGHNIGAIVTRVEEYLGVMVQYKKDVARSGVLKKEREQADADRQRFIEAVRRDFPDSVADLRQEHGRFVVSVGCGEDREKVRAVMTLLKSLAKPKETL